MRRIQDEDAVTTLPPLPPLAGPIGYFTNGNPANLLPATTVPDWWMNMIQEELCRLLSAANLPLDGTANIVQAMSLLGRRVQLITQSSLFTVPADVSRLNAIAVGGGSSGAGTSTTNASQVSCGAGGNSAAPGSGFYAVTPGEQIPVTIGVAGIWNFPQSTSGNGGTTSFGARLSSPGGIGPGANVPANPTPLTQGSAPSAQQASGGQMNGFETCGSPSLAMSGTNFLSGRGADCPGYGVGGFSIATASMNGNGASGFGAGGGGGATGPSNSGKAGGPGGPGCLFLLY
jgi:hypothetical protein